MRSLHVLAGGLLVGTLLGLAGCQKLNQEKEFSLEATLPQEFGVSGPTYNQKVEATLKAGGPINAYLLLDDNLAAVKAALESRKPVPAGIVLDSKEGAADITLNGDIPAKKSFTLVMVSPNKPLKVQAKILSK